MESKNIVSRAKELQPHLAQIRRDLHRHPEVGFDLHYTLEAIKKELDDIGVSYSLCGKAGIIVDFGTSGKRILLRSDMDALPVSEEADIEYKSENEGKMHGCGHDMHISMLLGAARILKENENRIKGRIRLIFQPAEEIFKGSLDMMENGSLNEVDAAMMLHVLTGYPIPSGKMLTLTGGVRMSGCEQYHITVYGKGGHGSNPHMAIDPITAAAHIHIAFNEINARELDPNGFGVFTTGKFSAGSVSNVIPDKAEMWGTIRTNDPTGKTGEMIKTRMTEIAEGVAKAFRCKAEAEFFDAVPCMVVDDKLSESTYKYMNELFGDDVMKVDDSGGGSEDFAFVSHKVPTVSMMISVGCSNDGYVYGLHNPKAIFDDSLLWKGAASYAQMGLRWDEENN